MGTKLVKTAFDDFRIGLGRQGQGILTGENGLIACRQLLDDRTAAGDQYVQIDIMDPGGVITQEIIVAVAAAQKQSFTVADQIFFMHTGHGFAGTQYISGRIDMKADVGMGGQCREGELAVVVGHGVKAVGQDTDLNAAVGSFQQGGTKIKAAVVAMDAEGGQNDLFSGFADHLQAQREGLAVV